MAQTLAPTPGRTVPDQRIRAAGASRRRTPWARAGKTMPWTDSLSGPEGVRMRRQGGDEPGAPGGDHVAAVVEDRFVSVVGVGDIGGGSRRGIEGSEEGEAG